MLSGILLFTVLHLFFISLFFISRKNKHSNLWLGLFFLILSLIEFMQLAYHKKWVYDFRYLNNTDYVYSCLLSTTFYLFVCASLAIKPQKWVLFVEFLVFVICLSHFVWFEFTYVGDHALKQYLDLAYVELPLEKRLLNLLIFLDMNFILVLSFLKTRIRQKDLLEQYSDLEKYNLNWMKSIILVIFVQYNILMPTFLFLPKTDVFQSFSPIFFSMTYLFVFWKAFNLPDLFGKQHNILYANKLEREERALLEERTIDEVNLLYTQIFQKVKQEMQRTEAFTDPNFSLEMASKMVDEKKGDVSKAINIVSGDNFFTFVNKMRVEKAKEMLEDEIQMERFSIEGIGKSCGFGSRSGFFSVFKKLEGCTPSEYKMKVVGT